MNSFFWAKRLLLTMISSFPQPYTLWIMLQLLMHCTCLPQLFPWLHGFPTSQFNLLHLLRGFIPDLKQGTPIYIMTLCQNSKIIYFRSNMIIYNYLLAIQLVLFSSILDWTMSSVNGRAMPLCLLLNVCYTACQLSRHSKVSAKRMKE